jgi:hypothetical protein
LPGKRKIVCSFTLSAGLYASIFASLSNQVIFLTDMVPGDMWAGILMYEQPDSFGYVVCLWRLTSIIVVIQNLMALLRFFFFGCEGRRSRCYGRAAA